MFLHNCTIKTDTCMLVVCLFVFLLISQWTGSRILAKMEYQEFWLSKWQIITLMWDPLCCKCCMMPLETAESSFTSAHLEARNFAVLQSFHHWWLQILGVHCKSSVAPTLGKVEYGTGWVVVPNFLVCHQHSEAVVLFQPCSPEKQVEIKQCDIETSQQILFLCCLQSFLKSTYNMLPYLVPSQSSCTSRLFWGCFGETWQKPLHVQRKNSEPW